MRRELGVVSLLLVVAAAPIWASQVSHDLIIRQRVGGGTPGAMTHEERQYWAGDKLVVDGSLKRTLVDFKQHTLTELNKDEQTYLIHTFADLQRQAVPKGSIQVQKTGKTRTILGYKAREYTVDGAVRGTVWATDALAIAPRAREWAALAAHLPQSPGLAGRAAQALAHIKGVPLQVSLTIGETSPPVEIRAEVVDIRRAAPPPDVLVVPTGYSKLSPNQAATGATGSSQ